MVLFGYDDVTRKFWLSDRDQHDGPVRVPKGQINQDYHLVDYDEVEKARSSSYRPFPANNKFLIFDFTGYEPIDQTAIQLAIAETCETMLHPPAQLLGINGMKKFSREILKWSQFPIDKLQTAGVTTYFQISQDGGTGGGIFRKMYGAFLMEAASIFKNDAVFTLGENFIEVAKTWDSISCDMWQLSQTTDVALLEKMSISILEVYETEKNLLIALKETIDNS